MKIRWKISVLIAALFAVLAISEIYVARDVLMPSFTALERREASVAMRRIDYGLQRALEQIQVAVNSWGNWADTYRFAQDHYPGFVEVNLTPIGLKELDVDIAIVEDLEGRILTSAGFEQRSGRALELDGIKAQMRNLPFPSHDDLVKGRMASGFLRTNRGVLMLAASPILDGLGRGPTRGSVVMGKLLSGGEVLRIGAQAQANLSVSAPVAGAPSHQIVQSAEATRISETFNDILGRPVVTATVELPRDITARGYSAVRYLSLYLIGAAVLVVVVLAVILNQVVLNPLNRMTRHAVEMGRDEDLTTRLNFGRRDEIGVLAREFDRMVARVAETRCQLVDQSFKAGFAELARGVLHNIGNAMTPIGVRLALLRTRLASIPAEDLALAAGELVRGDADPQRRRDLDEFVRLACAHLDTAVKAAAEDVEVMTRQTSLVQGALAEQVRSTGNEHVMESVRLRALLEQSLDVVPDAARQQLSLHMHPSLDGVGIVHVPRTVLSLVLQNFVINAADAVREAGKQKGSLVVTSEILERSEGRELVIHCADDGIGIAPENLQRVFEKGFSTKSRETNFGIGLHWCANAIGALGGRVWATSAGVGHGATLQVAIPLTGSCGSALTRAA